MSKTTHTEAGAAPARTRAPKRPRTRPIAIVIAGDDRAARETLARQLSTVTDMLVVGVGPNGASVLTLAQCVQPDIVLLDFSVRRGSPLDMVRSLNDSSASMRCRTIVRAEAVDAAAVATMVDAGVRGVLLKDASLDLICKGIRAVRGGELWLDRRTLNLLVETRRVPKPQSAFGGHHSLTSRETEVLQLVVNGKTNLQVATHLNVGEDTVKHHLTRIYQKVGVTSRLALALRAWDRHLVEGPPPRS
jgi:DNA-binding NarL/FixJ family response regulator